MIFFNRNIPSVDLIERNAYIVYLGPGWTNWNTKKEKKILRICLKTSIAINKMLVRKFIVEKFENKLMCFHIPD